MVIALDVTLLWQPATNAIEVETVAPVKSNTDVMATEELPASSHAPYMTIAVLLRKREKSITMALSPRNIS